MEERSDISKKEKMDANTILAFMNIMVKESQKSGSMSGLMTDGEIIEKLPYEDG